MRAVVSLCIALVLSCASFASAEVRVEGHATLSGEIEHAANLSGGVLHQGLLVLCPDEGVQLNVLKPADANRFAALGPAALSKDADTELDLEGMASDGRWLYAIGSHASARKKLDPDKTYSSNRQRLTEIKREDTSHLFRLQISGDGQLVSKEKISLRKQLERDELLARFLEIPSKENGIDIEGLAISEGQLYVGFRGPVLRGNYVPVMKLNFDQPADYELLLLNLAGRGIRDLAAVGDQILVLAGPMGDGPGSYELYLWNKRDCLPGRESPGGQLTALGAVGHADGVKPEGLVITEVTPAAVRLLLVQDGQSKRLDRLRVDLPR